ncbi:MAG: hypothetical protein E7591_03025 [Ruminococcaceae bacterium]|nr:hypothetical protein [Oscillospiraceae bacterium]
MKVEQLLNDLCKFLKMLPHPILLECIDNITFINRNERRKYERIKNLDNKIDALVQDVRFRVKLIENIHQNYNQNIQFSGDVLYEDLLASINSENCMSVIVYILYLCCDGDFDKQHFSKFIESEPFQKTIKKAWDTPTILEINSATNIIENTSFKEKKTMFWYLGNIELRSTYYNFKPRYIYEELEGVISEIPNDVLKEDFPEHGSINLGYQHLGDQAHEFLKSLNIDKIHDISDTTPITSVFAIHIENSDIENNDNDKIRKKIDLQKIYENGILLSDIIKPISDFKMYKIVTPQENIVADSFAGIIFVNEDHYYPEELVLLEWGENRLFGPYKLQERSIDGEKYIRPDSGSNQYLLEYYSEEDYESFFFEKIPYLHDSVFTDIAFLKKSPKCFDAIPLEILLSKLTESVDFNLIESNPDEFVRLYTTSPFLGQLPSEIRKQRIERVEEIFKSTAHYDDKKRDVLESLFDNLGDNVFSILGDKIKNSSEFKKLQEQATILQETNNKLKNDNDSLTEENRRLLQENTQLEENANHNGTFIDSEKIEELEQEIAELSEKVAIIDDYDSLSKDYDELRKKYQQETDLYDSKVIEVNEKKNELNELQAKFKSFITNELNGSDVTKTLRTAFDPYISNAMIEAAGKYQYDSENAYYKEISEKLNKLDTPKYEKEDLINRLVKHVQLSRKYTKNEILNIYICLSQNFLTIFSGEPGTGKTSICNILADSLGLNNFGTEKNISMNRYIPVSVERGWSSKRDLIGYFNPLTKKYDRNNSKIYDGLMLLNEERSNSRFPYVILLDEANLSPIEYYWADFMRAADRTGEKNYVNIGLNEDIYIPQTLRFLATINNDQTTERLSPRLVDRAWIIKLPKTSVLESATYIDNLNNDTILWNDIENAFIVSESKEMSLKNLAEQIYKLFDEHNLSVSPRVQQSIKRYVCVAQEIMEDEIGVSNKKEKALDFAIVQKLLPKINGYYKDYERLFTSLKQICDENNLKMTKEALIFMEDFQRQNMGYCQYLV